MTKKDFRWYKRTGGLPVPWWEQAVWVAVVLAVFSLIRWLAN